VHYPWARGKKKFLFFTMGGERRGGYARENKKKPKYAEE